MTADALQLHVGLRYHLTDPILELSVSTSQLDQRFSSLVEITSADALGLITGLEDLMRMVVLAQMTCCFP